MDYLDGQSILDLCETLGYNPFDVSQIVIEPGAISVTRFLRNDEGRKFTAGKEIASETVRRPILWPATGGGSK